MSTLPMQRLVARLFVPLLLWGTFAPLALAQTQSQAHSCCVRKQHSCSTTHDAGFQAADCSHRCCRGLAVRRNALPVASISATYDSRATVAADLVPASARALISAGPHSSRAPPVNA